MSVAVSEIRIESEGKIVKTAFFWVIMQQVLVICQDTIQACRHIIQF